MLKLNNRIKLKKDRKRVGRGGDLGGTSTKGHKGQKARSGGYVPIRFEGGQMPLVRRMPKRGFTNSFAIPVRAINLQDLEAKFEAGAHVDLEALRNVGLLKGRSKVRVKVLGFGELTKKLSVTAHAFSTSALEAIQKVGGEVKVIEESVHGSAVS